MDQAWGSPMDEAAPSHIPIEPKFVDGVYYDTTRTAEIAQCSTEHVRRACRNGTLKASQDRERGHWVAIGEECRAWVDAGRPSGQ